MDDEARRARHRAEQARYKARYPERVRAQNATYIAAHREESRARSRTYAQRQRMADPSWRVRQPQLNAQARVATMRVSRAIKRGLLVRPSSCSQCGGEGFIEGAHVDYARPLDVRWLCRPCHRTWDAAQPKGGTR